jgi:multiple antibiotic resistance protein
VVETLKFGLGAFVAVFTIVNPFSAAGMLVALTPGDSVERRRRQAFRAVGFMTGIMIVSFFAGQYILQFFSISQPALVLAAGLLVCRSGWRTLTGTERLTPAQREEGLHKIDISFTPLGMPMLAGPGTISVLIGLASDAQGAARTGIALVAILLVAAVSLGVLAAAPRVVAGLGSTGEAAISKVLGLIVLCVGIQFLINGFGMLLPGVLHGGR